MRVQLSKCSKLRTPFKLSFDFHIFLTKKLSLKVKLLLSRYRIAVREGAARGHTDVEDMRPRAIPLAMTMKNDGHAFMHECGGYAAGRR